MLRKKKPDLMDLPIVWNVYYHNINTGKITTFDIFQHGRFKANVCKYLQECNIKEDFAEQVRKELFYYFGSKCEYEVLVCSWCGMSAEKKVDIYSQVRLNYTVFIDYVWSFKAAICNTRCQ